MWILLWIGDLVKDIISILRCVKAVKLSYITALKIETSHSDSADTGRNHNM